MNDVTGERTFANGPMLRSVIERSLWRVMIVHIVKDLITQKRVLYIFLIRTYTGLFIPFTAGTLMRGNILKL